MKNKRERHRVTTRSGSRCIARRLLLVFAVWLAWGERLLQACFGCEWWTRNAVLPAGPGSQIGDLTALATEWAPGIASPRRGLMAERACHSDTLALWPSEGKPYATGLAVRRGSGSGQAEKPL